MAEQWYHFKEDALAAVAIEWLEDNGLSYGLTEQPTEQPRKQPREITEIPPGPEANG